MSNNPEHEIDLNSTAAPVSTSSHKANQIDVRHSSPNSEIVKLGQNMSDDEFLAAIANAPDEMLIPWEDAFLPSRGLYYKGWENGTVRVRAMNQSVEKAFANRRLIQTGEAIDRMFRSCVELPGAMDPNDMLVGDRTFLLYYIRGITFGNLYKFVATCPHCGAENTHTYDMNELYNTVIYANESLGSEPFPVRLPHLSQISGREMVANIRFLRSGDINDAMRINKFQRKLSGNTVRARRAPRRLIGEQTDPSEQLLDSSLEKMVVGINNNSDPNIVRTIVQRMHSLDNSAIRTFLRDNTPGLDTSVSVECQECGNEAIVPLPITEGFFQSAE